VLTQEGFRDQPGSCHSAQNGLPGLGCTGAESNLDRDVTDSLVSSQKKRASAKKRPHWRFRRNRQLHPRDSLNSFIRSFFAGARARDLKAWSQLPHFGLQRSPSGGPSIHCSVSIKRVDHLISGALPARDSSGNRRATISPSLRTSTTHCLASCFGLNAAVTRSRTSDANYEVIRESLDLVETASSISSLGEDEGAL